MVSAELEMLSSTLALSVVFGISDLGERASSYALLPMPVTVLPADALPEVGVELRGGEKFDGPWRLEIDDQDVTSMATVSATGIVYVPSEPLFEGRHTATATWNEQRVSWDFMTRSSPRISEPVPNGSLGLGERRPVISATFADVGSGIDLSTVRIFFGSEDVTDDATVTESSVSFQPPTDLEDGHHSGEIQVADKAGNPHFATIFFTVGQPPDVAFVPPDLGVLPFGSIPEIVARFSIDQGEIDGDSVKFRFQTQDLTNQAVIERVNSHEGLLRFTPSGPLRPNGYGYSIEVSSTAGLTGSAYGEFAIDRRRDHRLEVLHPEPGAVVTEAVIDVRVRADLVLGEPGELRPTIPKQVEIAGQRSLRMTFEDSAYVFTKRVALEPGENVISVRVEYEDKVVRESAIGVFLERTREASFD